MVDASTPRMTATEPEPWTIDALADEATLDSDPFADEATLDSDPFADEATFDPIEVDKVLVAGGDGCASSDAESEMLSKGLSAAPVIDAVADELKASAVHSSPSVELNAGANECTEPTTLLLAAPSIEVIDDTDNATLDEEAELALLELEFAEELELDEQRARDANTAAGVDTAAKLADLRAFGESLKQAPMAHESQPLAADINAPVYQAAAPFPNEDAEPLWRPEELQQQLDTIMQLLEFDKENNDLHEKRASIERQLDAARANSTEQAPAEGPQDALVMGFVRMAKAFIAAENILAAQEAYEKAAQLDLNHHEVLLLASALQREVALQPQRQVQFDSGKPLGMGLDTNPLWGADCMEGGYAVVVARFNEAENGEPSVAQKSGLVNAGDFVVAVNGASTVYLGYDEVIALLKSSNADDNGHLTIDFAKLDKSPEAERSASAAESVVLTTIRP